jgi:hypothetical protein
VDANTEVLQAAAQATYGLDLQGAARKATGLKLDLNGICRRLWGQEVNESFDDLLTLVGDHAFQPVFGGTLTTPDHADFAITNIDARWLGAAVWTPSISLQMIGQWTVAPNLSWVISIHPNRAGRLAVSTDGTAFGGGEATVPYSFVNNKAYWVRQTFENTGGNQVRTYYWSPATDGVNWTQLGDPVVAAGEITPFNTTIAMGVARAGFGDFQRFYAAEVRNGINGTVVCNPDVRGLASGTTSFQDSTGKTWTVGGFGRIS